MAPGWQGWQRLETKIRYRTGLVVQFAVQDMGESVMDIAKLIAARDPSEIVTCPAGATVRQAVQLLAEKRIGALAGDAG